VKAHDPSDILFTSLVYSTREAIGADRN
jgi:hypothetical protein